MGDYVLREAGDGKGDGRERVIIAVAKLRDRGRPGGGKESTRHDIGVRSPVTG